MGNRYKRNTDPATSVAPTIEAISESLRMTYDYLVSLGAVGVCDPVGAFEINKTPEWKRSGTRYRQSRKLLTEAGIVIDTGRRELSLYKKDSVVWAIKPGDTNLTDEELIRRTKPFRWRTPAKLTEAQVKLGYKEAFALGGEEAVVEYVVRLLRDRIRIKEPSCKIKSNPLPTVSVVHLSTTPNETSESYIKTA